MLFKIDRLNKVTKFYSYAQMGKIFPIAKYVSLLIDFLNPL